MPSELLDEFGRRLMEQVRDETIRDLQMILRGEMKGDRADRIRSLINDTDADVVDAVVPFVVDSALHQLLRWLEVDDNFRIHGSIGNTRTAHLAAESDGFAGELYTEQG